ncbi:MAG: hypothetical protein AAB599_01100 [Patescibacteria group bacterium]
MRNPSVQTKTHGINLAGNAPLEAAKINKTQSVVRRTSFIVLGVYFVVLLGVVGTHFFFLSQERKLIAEGGQLRRDIAGLSSIETLLETVKSRTTVATNILTSSPQAPERLLAEVIRLAPAEASIAEVNTQEGKFVISLNLPDSATVSELFKSIADSQFSSIFLDGLSKTTRGVYTVTLSVQ